MTMGSGEASRAGNVSVAWDKMAAMLVSEWRVGRWWHGLMETTMGMATIRKEKAVVSSSDMADEGHLQAVMSIVAQNQEGSGIFRPAKGKEQQ